MGKKQMKLIRILADADAVAKEAARVIATEARAAVAARGRFVMAVSGGKTPRQMLRALAGEDVPWDGVHVVQVDERIAPAGDPDRNLTHLRENLLRLAPLSPEHIHPMPVEEDDLEAAAVRYTRTLEEFAGTPPVLDLAHLGIGPDGHTASLIPGDPVLKVADRDVAITGFYQKRQRMTLTYPVLNRSRFILWVVSGAEKAEMLARLCDGDLSIPAGQIQREWALVLADQSAAAVMGRRQPSRPVLECDIREEDKKTTITGSR
jgi:6-phosphogluconolactonase